ncbi:MAG: CDP-alcohol phosphatidyltransferase family protein [Christensenellales bacterium]
MQETTATKEKRLIINRHTLLTVPNLLVLVRILCVPVYMTLLILGSRASDANAYQSWWVYLSLGIMIFAAITDIVDGKIARRFKAGTKIGKHVVKYDQGTYVGQLVDPIADKTMHIGVVLALAIAKTPGGTPYLHWAFIIFLVFRELMMIVIGSFVVNDVNIKANMLGKVASCIISCGAILCFFHPFFETLWKVYTLDWIVVTVGLVLNWAAAINYGVETFRQVKALKKEKKAESAEETQTKE